MKGDVVSAGQTVEGAVMAAGASVQSAGLALSSDIQTTGLGLLSAIESTGEGLLTTLEDTGLSVLKSMKPKQPLRNMNKLVTQGMTPEDMYLFYGGCALVAVLVVRVFSRR